MRLLIDECVSHQICAPLEADGHDVIHVVRDLAMAGSADVDLMALARSQHRVVISADTDFPALLAASGDDRPSVLLIREIIDTPPTRLGKIIAAQLRNEDLAEDLDRGAIVVIRRTRISVRDLPLHGGHPKPEDPADST